MPEERDNIGAEGEEESPLEDVLKKLGDHLVGGGFFRSGAGSTGSAGEGDWEGDLPAGSVVGDFKLIQPLGRGGMGQVWEAEEMSIQRRVALKLMHAHFELSEKNLERFEREAQAGGKLSHPSIVQVLSVGSADGRHYMAQELVEGSFTLADTLNDFRQADEVPEGYYRQMAALFAQIGKALAHAHEQGVIHRDIKPSNLLIGSDDQPKVADFGLAMMEDQLSLSRTGEFMGTPFYMSPEQAATKRMGIDHRTDVFSLGATLYEALTLARPFNGDTSQQVFQQILLIDPPDPKRLRSRVPRDLAVICLKALEKVPDQRYASMADFTEDLERYLTDRPILAKPPTTMQRAVKWARRNPTKSVAAGVAAVSLAALSGLYVQLQEEQGATTLALEDAKTERDRARGAEEDARKAENLLTGVRDWHASQWKGVADELRGSGDPRASILKMAEVYESSSWEDAVVVLEHVLNDRPHTMDSLGAETLGRLWIMYEKLGIAGEKESLKKRYGEIDVRLTEVIDGLGPEHHQDILRLKLLVLRVNHLTVSPEEVREVESEIVKTFGRGHDLVFSAMNLRLEILSKDLRHTEAVALAHEILERAEDTFAGHYWIGEAHRGVGYSVFKQGEVGAPARALTHLEKALEIFTGLFGTETEESIRIRSGVAVVAMIDGKEDVSEREFRSIYEFYENRRGPDHVGTCWALRAIAESVERQGRVDECLELLNEAAERMRRSGQLHHSENWERASVQAHLMYQMRRLEDGAEIALEFDRFEEHEDATSEREDALAIKFYLIRGLERYFSGARSEAVEILRRAVELSLPRPTLEKGLHALLGEGDMAPMSELLDAPDPKGQDPTSRLIGHCVVGEELLRRGDLEGARSSLKRGEALIVDFPRRSDLVEAWPQALRDSIRDKEK
jgi:tetratricopeptide (TPR) repeat protein